MRLDNKKPLQLDLILSCEDFESKVVKKLAMSSNKQRDKIKIDKLFKTREAHARKAIELFFDQELFNDYYFQMSKL